MSFGLVVSPSAASEEVALSAILAEYDRVKPDVRTLTEEIRQTRKVGRTGIASKTLEVRKRIGDLVKMLRRFDKDHLRASKGTKKYPERPTILKLFHTCDVMLRLIDAETKSTDYQGLGLKYEALWKQADTALTDDPRFEEAQRGTPGESPEQRLGR